MSTSAPKRRVPGYHRRPVPVSINRELNDVLVFLQVASSGSFTAAGKELGVPTSTVSRRVSRLEEELGVRLLQRTTRKLSLTEAGQLYYERGATFFAGLEETENMLAEAQANPKGRVRVAAPLEHDISVQLIASFLDRYPEVRVDLEMADRAVNIIEEGFDAGMVAGELTNPSVVAHKLMDSSFQVVASPDYLQRRGTPETPDDLDDHDCVVVGPASAAGTWVVTTPSGPETVAIRGRVAANHLSAARHMAQTGLGLAQLPTLSCRAALEDGTLCEVLSGWARPPVPIWITHAPGPHLAPAVRAFVEHVRENFATVANPGG